MSWPRRLGLTLLLLGSGCGPARLWAQLQPSVAEHAPPADAEVRALVLRAAVAESRAAWADADQLWGWVVKLDAANPYAWAGRGAFLERAGRDDEARLAYAHALGRDADHPAAHLGLGRIAAAAADDAVAVTHLEVAARAGSPDALALLGRLHLRHGEDARAEAVYEAWHALPVTVRGEWSDRGRLALAVGRASDAVDDLVGALNSAEGGPETAEILAVVARSACRVGTAWRWAVESRVAERDGAGWREVAVLLGRAARDPDLVEAALGPGEGLAPDLLADRVELLVAAGRVDAALALLDAAAAAAPDEPTVALRRATVLAGQGRTDEALAALDPIPLDSRFGVYAAGQRGEIHLQRGAPEAALAAIAPLVPPPWAAAKLRARALAALGRDAEAERTLFTEGDAEAAERWRQVGLLRSGRGDVAGALAALERAGDDPRALGDQARLLAAAGDRAGAAAAWTRLAARDPSDAATWRGLAGVVDDPLPWLKRAVQADPCEVDARLSWADAIPVCARPALLEAARDASPRDARVLDALAAAYHGCGVSRQDAGGDAADALEGLRDVEWTYRILGETQAAERVRALHDALGGA